MFLKGHSTFAALVLIALQVNAQFDSSTRPPTPPTTPPPPRPSTTEATTIPVPTTSTEGQFDMETEPTTGSNSTPSSTEFQEAKNCTTVPMMVEEIQYKDEQRCIHINQESCSQTYETVFKTSKVQDCTESFVKDCFIEYESVPRSEKIQICKEPLIRDCDIDGEETCSTEFQTICETTFHEAQVTDDVAVCEMVDLLNGQGQRHQCRIEQVESTKLIPETDCHQKNMTVCGSESCPIVKAERVCIDELKTFVEEVPKERCHLNPKKTCSEVNKVIPKLEMASVCIDVPKELCEIVPVEAERVQVEVNRTVCFPVL